MASEQNQEGQKGLGLFDAISIIVGIVIGTTIFKVPNLIFENCSDPWMSLGVWLAGGILALIGALCYAELAATYPRSGGDYYYLTRAFGPWAGFLFGWAQLLVVFTASIGAMAIVFGEYGSSIPEVKKFLADNVDLKKINEDAGDLGLTWEIIFACAVVILFTLLHLTGLLLGKITQDFLTVVKVISLGAILVAGFALCQSPPNEWKLALPENTALEGSGGAGVDKPFVFRNDAFEASLTLIDKGDKIAVSVKTLKKDAQKQNDAPMKFLKLNVVTSTDDQVPPDVVDVEKVYPFVQPSGEIKSMEFPLSWRGAPRTGIYKVEQVMGSASSLVWGALAMILVLYAFGGWNDAAFVAAEVRNPQRNIPRALIIGVALITLLYLLINAAYLMGLGFSGAKQWGVPSNLLEKAVHDKLGDAWKGWGSITMNILIVISAMGAVSGLIFTGARVYATLGNDYALFNWMGHWKPGKRAPILALLVQMIFTIGMLFMLGTKKGHELINNLLTMAHIQHQREWSPDAAFRTLVDHTAPVFWTFFLITGVSLFVLRARDSSLPRAFSVPLYPWLPIIFCNTCVFMLYKSIEYEAVGWRCLFAFGLVVIGIPFYWLACVFGGYRGDVVRQS